MPLDLSKMTPEQLAMTPSSISPNGIYNLENPYNEGKPAIITAGAFLIAIMLFFAGIRCYVKVFVQRKVTVDDCKPHIPESLVNGGLMLDRHNTCCSCKSTNLAIYTFHTDSQC
jgi:hypothetical protein